MAERPNIILIITDQQRYDTINALGYSYVDTPNLDRLVREGVTFENCFITAPSCAPARASLFTGYFPHTTGIHKNGDRWTRSWVEKLNESGYHCVNIGKMHTAPFETPLGFHERYVVENKDRYLEGRYYFDEWDKALAAQGLVKQQREQYRKLPDYNERRGAFEWDLPRDTHPDVFVGNTGMWWLDRKPVEKPLFLEIGFPGPHPPYDPTPEDAAPYLDRDFDIDEVTAKDLEGQPPPLKAMRQHNCDFDHDSVVHQLNPTQAQRQRQRAYYMANVTMIDEMVGKILDKLDEKGLLEDSVVMFTSDHGDCLGDHGHSQKWTMYDTITRVPTIVRSTRHEGNRKHAGLCQWMDLGPTILELAGAEASDTMEAESLLPVLEGEDVEGRKYVFAEHGRDGILQETEFMTMVRSKGWKLVHFLSEDFGQLFDLTEDPGESTNLWAVPEAQVKKSELLDVMRSWLLSSNVKTKNWAEEYR
ncbi:MAG: sulfatase-like hydrolase/transferase [Candidatus Latescibacterota bacterium]|nr:sulfatase-like hydrolase/transferase [Candidatus Latescibacterota bacterium]